MFNLFGARRYVATLVPDAGRLEVKRGQRLLDAALDAGLPWPHDCRVGSCGTCRCVLKSGRIKPLTDFLYTLPPQAVQAGVILACQTLFRSDCVIEVQLAGAQVAAERRTGRIARIHALTHDIQAVTVQFEAPGFRDFHPGQYFDVTAPGMSAPRSYSAVHAAGGGELVFFIRHVPGGQFTDWLFAADRTGERVALAGPYGEFRRHAGGGRMWCIAGGSGLAPINAVLEDAIAAGASRDCVLLFGVRTARDLYWQDELAALAARWRGRFEWVPVLSHEPPDSDWHGARGVVTDALAGLVQDRPFAAGDEAYLCGPPAMVDAGVDRLQVLGLPRTAIFFDRFLDASTMPGGRPR